ncbi:hypothetical protein PR202_ga28695 [Eleusine coracana subsp. coracana]|uniref:Uncharacterized protein n=1 Tax=Eleusine coracana subsp. coracana TaxID=191504 RepID=A0AAV5DHT2_ELECO|nr:hypothetical protein PR202_ga28695 [Eleusine coracana subsp. coracana]
MERPTDAFKETHNLVVAAEDTYVGGLVSNLQVAELIGFMATNREAAYCKVVEVIAETTAPLLLMDQLLSAIPSKREAPQEAEEEAMNTTMKLESDLTTTTQVVEEKRQQNQSNPSHRTRRQWSRFGGQRREDRA